MNKPLEAVIILAKCPQTHKTYGMRVENTENSSWLISWAFPIKETTAKREGYDKTSVKGNILFSDGYPGCPHCGNTPVTLCSCGHLNCTHLRNGVFTCEWCGMKGELGAYSGEAIVH